MICGPVWVAITFCFATFFFEGLECFREYKRVRKEIENVM